MNIPQNLMYTQSHEWIKFINDTTATFGLTDHAQEALGDLVFINLPSEGDDIEVGQSVADVESVKAVSDVYSPVSGTISKINEQLVDSPELINQTPYETWIVEVSGITDKEQLLTAAEYEKFVKEEE